MLSSITNKTENKMVGFVLNLSNVLEENSMNSHHICKYLSKEQQNASQLKQEMNMLIKVEIEQIILIYLFYI